MSGHSKWSTIKRKKAATDSKRGKLFTKLLKEIQIAAKMGGGAVEGNPRLKAAVVAAKSNSVPNDNIDRAIKRGTGDLEGVDYEEITYEGYGPAGVALLIKVLTDNRNRTVADVRYALTKYGGSLASTNAVAYLFESKGVLEIDKNIISEEVLYEVVLEAGADDIADEGDEWHITTAPDTFEAVYSAIKALGKECTGEIRSVPSTTVAVQGDDAEKLLKMLDVLDELEDVQDVFSNFDIDQAELDRIEG